MGGREVSRPYQNVGYRLEKFDAVFYQEIILSPGVFRRETASGFYPYAKCEAFHIAPRLFFMFLFFIPFTIRQQCIIYPHKFSIDPNDSPNVI